MVCAAALASGALAAGLGMHSPNGSSRQSGGHAATGGLNSSTLRLGDQIGPVWIGEPYRRVVRSGWGNGRGAAGSCGNGLADGKTSYGCRRYRVSGGYVWLGIATALHEALSRGRVVFLETTSARYKTADGVGVGFRIGDGERRSFDGLEFQYKTYSNFPPAWERAAYPKKPRHARCGSQPNLACRRWGQSGRTTDLLVKNGIVRAVMILRGDVWYT